MFRRANGLLFFGAFSAFPAPNFSNNAPSPRAREFNPRVWKPLRGFDTYVNISLIAILISRRAGGGGERDSIIHVAPALLIVTLSKRKIIDGRQKRRRAQFTVITVYSSTTNARARARGFSVCCAPSILPLHAPVRDYATLNREIKERETEKPEKKGAHNRKCKFLSAGLSASIGRTEIISVDFPGGGGRRSEPRGWGGGEGTRVSRLSGERDARLLRLIELLPSLFTFRCYFARPLVISRLA